MLGEEVGFDVGLRVGGALDLLGEGVVPVAEGEGLTCVDVGVGVEVGVGEEFGFGRLLIAYRAAPIIMPLVLSIFIETTRPLSSIPSEYPLLGFGR